MRLISNTVVFILSCLLTSCSNSEPLSQSNPTDLNSNDIAGKLPKVNASVPCSLLESEIKRLSAAEGASDYYDKLVMQTAACSLGNSDMQLAEAKTALGSENLSVSLTQNVLTLFAKSNPGQTPNLCCSIQRADWRALSDEKSIWGAKFRLQRPDEAMLMFMDVSGLAEKAEPIHIRGVNAPPDGPFLSDPKVKLAGETIQFKLESAELKETREITVYTPPKDLADENIPFLVMADGRSAAYYARRIEPMITQGLISPIALVGVHSGNRSISNAQTVLPEDTRMTDYLPGVSEDFPDRFDKHLAFVTQTLIPHVRSKYNLSSQRDSIAVAGQSNGAVFAMYAALERPDIFGSAIITSPGFGTLKTAPEDKGLKSHMFISAGLYERGFLKSARESAKVLKQDGYTVTETWNAAGHGSDQTTAMLYKHLQKIFPAEP